jgi:death-on-curing protein
MIDIKDVIRIHEILIDNFGGSKGVRDRGLLESAISRPFQTFDKVDLYSNPVEKAAALIESVLINHPFVDGNKRIGYVLMRLLLIEFGFDIIAAEEEKYDFVIKIAEGKYHRAEIIEWIIDKIGDNKL